MVPGIPPLRLLRLANPGVRSVLRSPAHRLLSARLLVLTYRGHRSGRSFSIPLRYAALSNGRVVSLAVEPDRKLWWRSFADPREAELALRGRRRRVVGTLATGATRHEARAAYVARYPRSSRLAANAAFVVFTPAQG